ncbi:hypothetical protein ACNKHK_00570 [Shigella flexneri]
MAQGWQVRRPGHRRSYGSGRSAEAWHLKFYFIRISGLRGKGVDALLLPPPCVFFNALALGARHHGAV